MPYRRKTQKPRRGKRRTWRRRRPRNQMSIQRGLNFANQQLVTMRYVDTIQLNPAAAGLATTYQFRANSIQDPDLSGVGHQPLSHDEWSNFYWHYMVVGSKINVKFLSRDTTNNANTIVGVLTRSTTTPGIVNATTLIEQGKTGYSIIGNATGGKTYANKNAYFSMKKFFGIKDVRDAIGGSQFKTPFGSNPTEDVIYEVFVNNMDALQDAATIDCLVTIDYCVMLIEPKTLNQS